jgi:hypothetical protein
MRKFEEKTSPNLGAWQVAESGKRYQLEVAPNGDHLWHYQSGAVYNKTVGHLVHGPGTQNSEGSTNSVGEPPQDASPEPGLKSTQVGETPTREGYQDGSHAVVSSVISAQARLAHDIQQGSASTRAAGLVLKALGAFGGQPQSPNTTSDGILRLEIDPRVLDRLADLLAERMEEGDI